MGNNTSTQGGGNHTSAFRRGTGSLGLSRLELDSRSKPSGLYSTTSTKWDDKTIRRLIGDGKLASRLIGTDIRLSTTSVECPICFLYYSQVNTTNCCKASICTECWLQVQADPKDKNASCPFCNTPKVRVKVKKPLSDAQVDKREVEEQKVVEATILARANSANLPSLGSQEQQQQHQPHQVSHSSSAVNTTTTSTNPASAPAMDDKENTLLPNIQSLALTKEERIKLERQMSSQSHHPLLLQMQRDAQAERDRHMVEHATLRAERRRDRVRQSRQELERLIRSRRAMEQLTGWSAEDDFAEETLEELVEEEEEQDGMRRRELGGGRERPPRINDLFMLEAALYLSMREGSGSGGNSNNANTRQNRRGDPSAAMRRFRSRNEQDPLLRALMRMDIAGGEDIVEEAEERRGFGGLMSEETQIEMAIQASLRDEEERTRMAEEAQGSNDGEEQNSDGDESVNANTGLSGDESDSFDHNTGPDETEGVTIVGSETNTSTTTDHVENDSDKRANDTRETTTTLSLRHTTNDVEIEGARNIDVQDNSTVVIVDNESTSPVPTTSCSQNATIEERRFSVESECSL